MKPTRELRDFCYAYDFLFKTEEEQKANKFVRRGWALNQYIPYTHILICTNLKNNIK